MSRILPESIPNHLLEGPEPSRARCPEAEGFLERDGVRLFYEVHGEEEPTILFLPTSWMTHSRMWKAQVPYLARHFRVVAFDGRGNGRADRPRSVEAYRSDRFAADAIAVMDETKTEAAVIVTASAAAIHGLLLCAGWPGRVLGACFVGPFTPLRGEPPGWMTSAFNRRRASYRGWEMYNRHCLRADWRGFVEMWARRAFPEAHSSRQIEDTIAFGLETDGFPMAASLDAHGMAAFETVAEMMQGTRQQLVAGAAAVRCPALVACGSEDSITPPSWSTALAKALDDARLAIVEGMGHFPPARHPVWFNLLLREFVESIRAGEGTRSGAAA